MCVETEQRKTNGQFKNGWQGGPGRPRQHRAITPEAYDIAQQVQALELSGVQLVRQCPVCQSAVCWVPEHNAVYMKCTACNWFRLATIPRHCAQCNGFHFVYVKEANETVCQKCGTVLCRDDYFSEDNKINRKILKLKEKMDKLNPDRPKVYFGKTALKG